MDKRIIYTQDDGTVAVVIPADCGLTIEQIAEKSVPAGKEYKIVDVSEIPSDRTYRNAWKHDDGVISVDSAKKKVIDDAVAKKEVDALVAEKQKELAIASLKVDGVLDASGKIKEK